MVALPRMKGAPPKKSIQKKAPTPKAEAPRQQQRPGGGKKKVYDSGSDSDDMDEDVQINTVSSGKKRGREEDVKKPASKKSKTGDESSQATKKGSKDSKAKVGKEDKAKAGKKRKERDDDSDDESDAEERRQKNINADGTSPLTNFKVCKETIAKLEAGGIKALFPIQAATFNHVFEGKDLIARARTGTGKTLSFVLPVHELMLKLKQSGELKQARGRGPACIVLSPTRELARQITKVFEMVAAGSFTVLPVYGGVPYIEQERPLQNGVDIVVGTPGRVIDLFDRSKLNITQIRYFVLDEADEMLNVGFKDSVDKLFEAVNESAAKRGFPLQTLLFSATVPEWISSLTSTYFRKGLTETVDLVKGEKGPTTATRINHLCIPCPWSSRARTIGDIVLCYAGQHGRTIIFTETKKEANELALDDAIKQDCAVLHGDIAQAQRETTFQAFRDGKFRCLVATDVCARGLDIPEIDLVLMCHPTKDGDTYVHRSGRTGRAGRSGTAVTFYTPRELGLLRGIERRIGAKMKVISAPQPADIVKANARDIKTSIADVHPDVLPLFGDVAEEMIAEMGASAALASALAVITGQTKPLPPRSMLTSLEGYKTFVLKVPNGLQETRNVFAILRQAMPQEFVSSIRQIRLFKGETPAVGAAFDVPIDKVGVFTEAECPRGAESLEEVMTVDDLPELCDPPMFGSPMNGGGQRGGFNNGGSPGRGGFGGGGQRGGRSPGGGGRSPGGGGGGPDVNERKVFCGGLQMNASEGDVSGIFEKIGAVERVTMLHDQETNMFKGVAFVTLSTKEAAEAACAQLNGTKVSGRNLRVNMAASKRQ